jgi:hypothetical protein
MGPGAAMRAGDPRRRVAKQCGGSCKRRKGFLTMGESTQTKSGARWQPLVIRVYLVTMGMTVLITLLTIIFLVDTSNCSSVERGLLVLAGTTAVLCLASIAVVGVGVWKAIPTIAERLAVVVGYGAMVLASFVVIACGLMVVFNC